MTGKKIAIIAGVMFSILILPSVSSIAFAQYMPPQETTGLPYFRILKNQRKEKSKL